LSSLSSSSSARRKFILRTLGIRAV